MEGPDHGQSITAPLPTESDPWQRRIERRAAYIRRRQVKRLKARQRHSIAKTTLVDTLFNFLDIHNIGALGQDELDQFALLTGFQWDREELYDEVSHLLHTWGSTHGPRFFANKISMLHFRQTVSRTGPLTMSKAELRRTIRYCKAPEIQSPRVQYGHGRWHSLKHMRIFSDAQQWKQGVVWHRYDPAWFLNPGLCSDPNCPFKTHPEYFRGM